MHHRNSFLLLRLFVLLYLSGCTTTTIEQRDAGFVTLPNRILSLEAQARNKDAQIAQLSHTLEKEKQEKQQLLMVLGEREKKIKELTQALRDKKRPKSDSLKAKNYLFSVILIQTALKNAGYNPGIIDGKMGTRTQVAIKEFQRAKGLSVNGRVDKQTWTLLREYL